jgi:UDP-glucose 4-epimerase
MQLTFDRVLVTGGAGFIGSHTVDALVMNGAKVWVLDDLSTGRLKNLRKWRNEPAVRFTKGSITREKTIESMARKVEAIIHLAALVSPNISVRNPGLTNEINVSGTLNVLRAALRNDVQKVVFASSSSVYGNAKTRSISEDAPLNPITPYGASKLAGEKYCLAYYSSYDLRTISLRYLNVYGERQSSNPYSGVIAIFARKLRDGRPPIIYGDGNQTRDFIYVSDVARANLLALTTTKGIGESFNVGTGRATSIKQLCRILVNMTGKDVKAVFQKARPGDIRHSCANINKARVDLNFEPKVSLRQGLRIMLESPSIISNRKLAGKE